MLGLGRIFSSVRELYNELNPATFTGAIDVIVVEQPDGSLTCTPFYVRFGKIGVLRSREKLVDMTINDEPVELFLKLSDTGEAYFVEDIVEEREMDVELATSPLPTTSADKLIAHGLTNLRKIIVSDEIDAKSKSQSPPQSSLRGGIKLPVKKLSDVTHMRAIRKMISVDDEMGDKEQKKVKRKLSKLARRENISNIRMRRQRLRSSSWTGGILPDGVISLPGESSAIAMCSDKDEERDELADVFEEPTTDGDKNGRKKLTKLKMRSDSVDKKTPKSATLDDMGRQMSGAWATPSENLLSPGFKDAQDDVIFQLDFSDEDTTVVSPTSIDKPYQYQNGAISVNGEIQKSQSSDYFGSDCESSPMISADNSRVTTPTDDNATTPVGDNKAIKNDNVTKVEWSTPEVLDVSTNVDAPKVDSVAASTGRWGISNVWNLGFIRRSTASSSTGAGGHSSLNKPEGIYLDDLLNSSNKTDDNAIDPQLASLYLDNRKRNLTESNKIQKAKTVAFDIVNPVATSSNEDDGYCSIPSSIVSENRAKRFSRQLTNNTQKNLLGDIQVSFCGRKKSIASKQRDHSVLVTNDQFEKGKLAYEDFVKDPDLLFSKQLVIKLNENYYDYKVAVPVLISKLIFQRPISAERLNKLCSNDKDSGDITPSKNSAPVIIHPRTSTISDSSSSSSSRTAKAGSSWFSWRRAASAEPEEIRTATSLMPISNIGQSGRFSSTMSLSPPGMDERDALSDGELEDCANPECARTSSRYRKSLHLSSDQLKSLNLKPDVANRATFSVTTKYQGTCLCECCIYLWKWDDKIVISDVDGTITKSDVLGHLMPIVGRQWEHANVAALFTNIVDNGYKIMYLTARAIGQSQYTKDYLRSIKQCDYELPDGPLQMSPCSILSAFHREVIEKKPEIFKMKCLQDIKSAFPDSVNPFYGGFGNRSTDEVAYKNSGIPESRIFTISWSGEVIYSDKKLRSSYQMIAEIMDHIFPPLFQKNLENRRQSLFTNPETYSAYTYWKDKPSTVVEIDTEKFSPPNTADNYKKQRKSGTAGLTTKK